MSEATFPPLSELLPHRPPMILLDEVLAFDGDLVRCGVRIGPDTLFVCGDRVRNAIAVEYMAQTVGVYVGLLTHADGGPVEIGYLIGVREMVVGVASFAMFDRLEVSARKLWGNDVLGSFETWVHRDGVEVARATMSVFRGDPDSMQMESAP